MTFALSNAPRAYSAYSVTAMRCYVAAYPLGQVSCCVVLSVCDTQVAPLSSRRVEHADLQPVNNWSLALLVIYVHRASDKTKSVDIDSRLNGTASLPFFPVCLRLFDPL